MSAVLDRVLERLDRVRRSGQGWICRCPAHEDRRASLSIAEGNDGRALIHCHAGCAVADIVAAIGLEIHDLFPEDGAGIQRPPRTAATVQHPAPGCTLEAYAEAKRLPISFLTELGLTQITVLGKPAVRMPYLDTTGNEISVRHRVGLTGDVRVKAKAGSKLHLYGLNRLSIARDLGYVVVVEGESDAHTLWSHGLPALGLPGANNWSEERDLDHLDGVSAIYVVIEPDRGGQAVLSWLARSEIRHRVRLVRLEGAKDPSELHVDDPDRFLERFELALRSAIPWGEHERIASDLRRGEAWAACDALAREPRILERLDIDVAALGHVGDRRLIQLTYLAMTSRLLARIVSEAVKGPSAVGKSHAIGITLRFFPESSYFAYTGMSERALVFGEEDLRHRMLVIYEAAGLEEDFRSYLVRTLLSEGRIAYPITEKGEDGKHRTRTVVREGPTGLIVTTTAVKLHEENETRLISLVADDSTDQTRRILHSLAAEAEVATACSVDFTRWHALQEWLAEGDATVVIPFATTLAKLVPPAAVRLRRDFGAVLGLVKAHALLHRATRETSGGAIVATLDDYAVVRELVADLVSEGIGATVSPATREIVAAVTDLIAADASTTGVSITHIAQKLRLDKASASRRWQVARDRGFLKNLETTRGRPARIVLDEPLPDEVEILPSLETLEKCCGVASVCEEQAPPSLPDTCVNELKRLLPGDDGYLEDLWPAFEKGHLTPTEWTLLFRAHARFLP